MINHEIHCANCRYDVRGLQPSGECPECGMPIGITLRYRKQSMAFPFLCTVTLPLVALFAWGMLALIGVFLDNNSRELLFYFVAYPLVAVVGRGPMLFFAVLYYVLAAILGLILDLIRWIIFRIAISR